MNFKKPRFWDYKKPTFLSYFLLPFTLPLIINNFFLKLKKKDEFNKILQQLKVDIKNFNKASKERLNLIEKIKLNATKKLMNEVKIILIEYSDKESISIVVEKKSIIIGKTELDLTEEVLVIIDKKIESIKLDE